MYKNVISNENKGNDWWIDSAFEFFASDTAWRQIPTLVTPQGKMHRCHRHKFSILVINNDRWVNWNISCSSDRYTFKALSGGHFGCLQTGCKAKRTTSNSHPVRYTKLHEMFCRVNCSLDFAMQCRCWWETNFFLIGLMSNWYSTSKKNIHALGF